MNLKSIIKAGLTLVVFLPFLMMETSCGRRVVPVQANQVNVNTVSAPQKHVPTSRKEIRILKKARKSGVY